MDPTFQINDPDPYADGYAAVVEIIGNTPAPSEVAPSPAELDTPVAPAPEVIPDRGEDNTGVGMAERLGLVLLFFGLLAFVVVFVLSRTNAGFVPHQRSDTT